LCGQCQLAARDKVELLRFAPHFQHDGAHRIARQGIGGGPQGMIDIGGVDADEKTRIETEFGKPAHRDGACFNFRKILPDPDHGPPRCHASCEPRDKTGCHRALSPCFRKHLVQGAQSEPTLQTRIGLGVSERHPAQRMRRAVRLDAFDAAA